MKEDTRPAKNGWAPGQYWCQCRSCGEPFWGDKRAWTCADCAYQEPDPALVIVGGPRPKSLPQRLQDLRKWVNENGGANFDKTLAEAIAEIDTDVGR